MVPSPFFALAGAILFSVASAASLDAAVLVRYEFGTPGSETTAETGAAYSPTFIAPGFTATAITDPLNTIAIEISSAATTPVGAPFLRVDPQGSSASAGEAVTNNKYFQFTLAPTSGDLDLTSLTFDATRGGGATPRGYVVRSSVDNFSTNLATADLATQRPTYTPVSVDLSGPSFQDLTSPVTFRIYSYSPNGGASVDYDNIVVNGIPEPSSVLLLSAGLLGLAVKRRRTS